VIIYIFSNGERKILKIPIFFFDLRLIFEGWWYKVRMDYEACKHFN